MSKSLQQASKVQRPSKALRPNKVLRRTAVVLVSLAVLIAPAPLASAHPSVGGSGDGDRPAVITLPGASSAEGIAAGEGKTFYAGDLGRGDIFRGNIRTGKVELFIDAPDGRAATGMKVDKRHDLLFVAGGPTGQAYVYSTTSGATVATYQLASPAKWDPPSGSFINDVALTRDGAWFTNSKAGELYFVPVDEDGKPGSAKTVPLTGPAAFLDPDANAFNLNGIATADHGCTLIVAHSARGQLYTVNPDDGSSAEIANVSVPNADGIVVQGRSVWVVQNQLNKIARFRLNEDLTSGRLKDTITNDAFQIPTTAARFGNTLAVVNAKFGAPAGSTYEVVLVDARDRDSGSGGGY
ncbi:MAG: hypothetical protein JWO93_1916 [Micrococcaceae bacterium]|nr:hypothetical protein [Micrococcaceae bacterium]